MLYGGTVVLRRTMSVPAYYILYFLLCMSVEVLATEYYHVTLLLERLKSLPLQVHLLNVILSISLDHLATRYSDRYRSCI